MNEDIEIMRRLLNRAIAGQNLKSCTSCHGGTVPGPVGPGPEGGPAGLLPHHSGHHGYGHPFPGAEGVYLKGQGVVYTLTLQGTPQAPKGTPAKEEKKPLSEWDRLRKELRGEKVDTPAPQSKEPALSEVILVALAQHGHNFSQLSSTESVTAVVTFREAEPGGARGSGLIAPDGGPPGPGGPPPGPTLPGEGGSPGGPARPGQGGPEGGSGVPPAGPEGSPTLPGKGGVPSPGPGPGGEGESESDYELLGDLHLKRGQAKDALAAYKKALETAGPARRRVLIQKSAVAVLNLADRASSQAQKDDLIDQAVKLLQQVQKQGKTAQPAAPPTRLPARLIVSAPKRLLDQVGGGKMTFAEFRRQVTVEFQPAAVIEQKK
jgi:hypothetical protein